MATEPSQLELPDYSRADSSAPVIFRPIHYIGSKLRLIDSIIGAIEAVAPGAGPVCDLFAGSGTVSMALAHSRPVIAVDVQEFSRTVCSALLRRQDVSERAISRALRVATDRADRLKEAMRPLIDHEESCFKHAKLGNFDSLCDVVEQGSLVGFETSEDDVSDDGLERAMRRSQSRLRKFGYQESVDGLICRYFGGVYFSYAQAAELDGLLAAAATVDSAARDVFVAAALSSASAAVNTVGKHFAQPIRPRDSAGKPKRHVIAKILQDRSIDILAKYPRWICTYLSIPVRHYDNQALRSDYRAMLSKHRGKLAAVYADPPYTRDHYSRFYHVLETMCLRDAPGVSMIKIGGEARVSRGLYRPERHQSPFCIRSQAPKAFADLFQGVSLHGAPLVLSYSPNTEYEGSRPRVMTIEAITELARSYFSSVEVRTPRPISHSKLNSSERILGQSADAAERLLICRP